MDYEDMEQESRLFPWIDDVSEECEDCDDVGNYDIYSNDWES